jgi:hypothetical protein
VIFEMKAAIKNKEVRRGIPPMVVAVSAVMALVFSLSVDFSPVGARPIFAPTLCGNGSPPDYGFTYDLQQNHWTVGWEDHASEQAVTDVDSILDKLNADSIAQTMILILPQDQVGNRVNCAVHFLRYMKLGLPTGERKDNGFVFLIVVETTVIDVHYGVGLGLPALTAPELTALNRSAEDAYQSTYSLDQALLTLVQGFDTVARSKYPPLISPTPTPETNLSAQPPSGPLGILSICGQLCLGIIFLLFLIWVVTQGARRGISSNSSDMGSGGTGFPLGGGGGEGWGGGGGGSGPSTRGGSGSGRSGRGN